MPLTASHDAALHEITPDSTLQATSTTSTPEGSRKRSAHELSDRDHSMHQARVLKQRIDSPSDAPSRTEPESSRHEVASSWFARPDGEFTKHISYDDIIRQSDSEYLKWRSPPNGVEHVHTLDASLDEWMRDTPMEMIAHIIERMPRGLESDATNDAFEFTPWQRLSMAFYLKPFFSCSSTVSISAEEAKKMLPPHSSVKCPNLLANMHLRQGIMRDFGIIDLPTAAGKTAWVLSVALMLLRDDNLKRLRKYTHARDAGSISQGPVDTKLARLVIVSVDGNVFQHFVDTVKRLIPNIYKDPNTKVKIWTSVGAKFTTALAYDNPDDTVVVWFVPAPKVAFVLQAHPEITIPICIFDEHTPKSRSASAKSRVLKVVVTQATPTDLEVMTSGTQSQMKEAFGGALFPPSTIRRLVSARNFKCAALAMDQLCKLDLMTLTPFRSRVRDDLRTLVPMGLELTFVPSRRVSLTSHIMRSENDMVPAPLKHVILAFLSTRLLDGESRRRIDETIVNQAMPPGKIAELVAELSAPEGFKGTLEGRKGRLLERIKEFSTQCPICFKERPENARIMGCCGYCVCEDCFEKISFCDAKCAFCRSQIQMSKKAEVEAMALGLRCLVPEERFTFAPEHMCAHTQLQNVAYTLRHARSIGCKRMLLVCEREAHTYRMNAENFLNFDSLGFHSGVQIECVDTLVSGKGRRFAELKRMFDTPGETPMCLASFESSDKFLVGTDLAHADCFIAVGNILTKTLTQAIGRIMRPLASRDNSKPVHMFKVYVE